ncbi:hypothetical protein ACA910_016576 [Epithemia clementina (nom. ined.)]
MSFSMLTRPSFGWLPLLFVLSCFFLSSSSVDACSCILRYKTFEETFDEADHLDAIYIFGQVKVNPRTGRFAGYVDPDDPVDDINADIYFLAYNWKSYKGCSREGSYEIYESGGNSGVCGVSPTPGWYVAESYKSSGNQIAGLKRLQLCNYLSEWQDFTYDQYVYAQANKDQCGYHAYK